MYSVEFFSTRNRPIECLGRLFCYVLMIIHRIRPFFQDFHLFMVLIIISGFSPGDRKQIVATKILCENTSVSLCVSNRLVYKTKIHASSCL